MSKCPQLTEPYDWWNYAAPVVPPTKVIEKVLLEQRYHDWQNIAWSGSMMYAMFYRTAPVNGMRDIFDEGFVTYLLPGSCRPVSGWLIRISPLTEPPEGSH